MALAAASLARSEDAAMVCGAIAIDIALTHANGAGAKAASMASRA